MIQEVRNDLIETRLITCENIQEMAIWLDKIYKDFDVINYHNDPVQLMAFGKKIPSVWLCNEPPSQWLSEGTLPENQKDVVRKFIKKVIVADKLNQERFKEIYNIDSEIINYGVDYDFWQKGNKERFLKKHEIDVPIISQVAWIHPMKNQKETLKIFNLVHQQFPNIILVLSGPETNYKQELEDYIFGNDLQGNVIFTGFISQEEIRDLYKASSVILQPIKSQGGSLAVFDAMASGCPVVVSNEATCSSILKENKLGYVGRTEEMADYIIKLLGGKEKQDIKKQKEFVKKMSWDKFCEKMLEVFNDR